MNDTWKINIDIISNDFESLRTLAQQTLQCIADAKSVKDLYSYSAGGGNSEFSSSVSVNFECPTKVRIDRLRQEADELEASLSKPI